MRRIPRTSESSRRRSRVARWSACTSLPAIKTGNPHARNVRNSVFAALALRTFVSLHLHACGRDRLLASKGRLLCVRVTHTRVCGMPATYPVSNPEEFSPERLGLVRDHLKD